MIFQPPLFAAPGIFVNVPSAYHRRDFHASEEFSRASTSGSSYQFRRVPYLIDGISGSPDPPAFAALFLALSLLFLVIRVTDPDDPIEIHSQLRGDGNVPVGGGNARQTSRRRSSLRRGARFAQVDYTKVLLTIVIVTLTQSRCALLSSHGIIYLCLWRQTVKYAGGKLKKEKGKETIKITDDYYTLIKLDGKAGYRKQHVRENTSCSIANVLSLTVTILIVQMFRTQRRSFIGPGIEEVNRPRMNEQLLSAYDLCRDLEARYRLLALLQLVVNHHGDLRNNNDHGEFTDRNPSTRRRR